MKIIICPDKFKGSITALEVASTISDAVISFLPDTQIIELPMADGGEGTIEVLTRGRGELISIDCFDPLMRPHKAIYGRIGNTAIIDLSQEVGLMLLSKEERNPEKTSTYGLGMVIKEVIEKGAERIVLGIGGSATNDCGIGMLAAMGASFRDSENIEVTPIGENLSKIEHITPIYNSVPIVVACDVTNLLYGSKGAAWVYAPQKGADAAMCERLDNGLRHFSAVVQRELKIDLSTIVGGGAAGGVGAALSGFLRAEMVNGTDFIANELGLFEQIKTADLVITGEGRVDRSTLHDKLIHTIAKHSKVPVLVVCGTVDGVTAEELGVRDIIELKKAGMSVEEAIKGGKKLLYETICENNHKIKEMI